MYGIFNLRWAEVVAPHCRLTVFTPPAATQGQPALSPSGTYNVREAPFSTLFGAKPPAFVDADLVQVLSPSAWAVSYQSFAAVRGSPTIVVDHSLGLDSYWHGLSSKTRLLYRAGFRMANLVVALNGEHAARLDRLGLTKWSRAPSVVISNVVDERFVDVGKNREKKDNRGRLGPRFVHVSGLSDDLKNVSAILRAFALLLEDAPDGELHICGSGGDQASLRRLAWSLGLGEPNLYWRGHLQTLEVAEVFAQSDCLVMASRKEVDSCVVSEAIAARLPVLTTAVSGMKEKVTPGRGWLLPGGSPNEIALAMKSFARGVHSVPPALDGTEPFLPWSVSSAYLRTYERLVRSG